MRISVFVLLFSVFSIFGLVAKYDAPNPDNAKLFMQEVIDDGKINIPKNKNNQENYNYFKDLAINKFAMSYMSAWSLGKHYKSLNAKLKDKYVSIITDYMVLFYADMFSKYYQSYIFKVVGAEQKGDEFFVNVLVKPKNNSKNQDSVINAIWRLKYSKDIKNFLLVDVSLNGVSVLLAQRSEFESSIRASNNSVADFIAKLEKKVNDTKKQKNIK